METVDFASNLPKYHNFGAFSDVTIEFGSQKIKGHKIILAQGSEYFKTLLGGKFKEAKCSYIRLYEDKERALSRLIEHLYDQKWDVVPSSLAQDPMSLEAFVDAYVVGQKYLVQSFRTNAERNIRRALRAAPNTDSCHILLARAVRYVYITHSEAAADLRWVLVDQFTEHVSSVSDHDVWKELFREVPEFAHEAMDAVLEQKSELKAVSGKAELGEAELEEAERPRKKGRHDDLRVTVVPSSSLRQRPTPSGVQARSVRQ